MKAPQRHTEKATELTSEPPILLRLHGGKRWSTGEATNVAADVLLRPELFSSLLKGLGHNVPLVRMRSAYAISKIVSQRADLLQPHKEQFLDYLVAADNNHLARACMLQTLHHLDFNAEEINLLKDVLKDFMFSESSIVRTFSLQLLVDFAEKDVSLRQEVIPILWDALNNGTAAMRARARKLMKKYKI